MRWPYISRPARKTRAEAHSSTRPPRTVTARLAKASARETSVTAMRRIIVTGAVMGKKESPRASPLSGFAVMRRKITIGATAGRYTNAAIWVLSRYELVAAPIHHSKAKLRQ